MDMCSLKRPFDDQSHARIQLETLAVIAILHLCREGNADLLTSDALAFENSRNPDELRKELAGEVLALAKESIAHTAEIEVRASELSEAGLATLDALHLASAEAALADAFCTCDDALASKARTIPVKVRVLSPTALAEEVLS